MAETGSTNASASFKKPSVKRRRSSPLCLQKQPCATIRADPSIEHLRILDGRNVFHIARSELYVPARSLPYSSETSAGGQSGFGGGIEV